MDLENLPHDELLAQLDRILERSRLSRTRFEIERQRLSHPPIYRPTRTIRRRNQAYQVVAL